jgi:Ni/Co efflux regulator RcnB
MKKFVTAAVAAVIATSSLGLAATAADAQARPQDRDRREQVQDRRQDNREDRQDRREDRRDDRRDNRQERRQDAREDRQQQQRAYARWQRAERRYTAPRWQQPRGQSYRVYSAGQRLPSAYNTYVINDYSRYGLRAPPRGYQYVRNNNDVILAAVAGGLITAVIAGLFN